jgi:lipoprotein-anchoring transpeptidase ErfK/SrfK
MRPLSRRVPAEAKRIVISIEEQSLTAYEEDQAVFQTKVSSGVPDRAIFNTNGIPTDTPQGNFHIQFKTPSRHMGDGNLTDDINAYELPGVPWTMVFQKDGIALHGTYWHTNFGARMSHGCVNLSNEDARWLFRWTDPVFTQKDWYVRGEGTLVQVV